MKATPLSDYERRTANLMTSHALASIALNSGMRCRKRSNYAAIESELQYFKKFSEWSLRWKDAPDGIEESEIPGVGFPTFCYNSDFIHLAVCKLFKH
jgi:hypothetical protein